MGWVTLLEYSKTGEYTDSATRQHRQVIPADTAAVDGTKVRITIQASTGTSATLGGTSIGESTAADDFAVAPTRITWDSGSDTTTITAGQSKMSDETTFAFNKTKRYLVHQYQTARNIAYGTSVLLDYWSSDAVDRTMTQSVAFSGPSNAVYILKFEIYVADAYQGIFHRSKTISGT